VVPQKFNCADDFFNSSLADEYKPNGLDINAAYIATSDDDDANMISVGKVESASWQHNTITNNCGDFVGTFLSLIGLNPETKNLGIATIPNMQFKAINNDIKSNAQSDSDDDY
jgi:hypothetical protein